MLVKDLIAKLQTLDPNLVVVANNGEADATLENVDVIEMDQIIKDVWENNGQQKVAYLFPTATA